MVTQKIKMFFISLECLGEEDFGEGRAEPQTFGI